MQPNPISQLENQKQLLTLTRKLPADFETPASAYLKLATSKPSFLLESITGGEQIARYSFIGVDIDEAFILEGGKIHHRHPVKSSTITLRAGDDPLDILRQHLLQQKPDKVLELPRFSGGLVGYLGYNAASYFEPSLSLLPHQILPEAIFLSANTMVAFDHAFGQIILIANVPIINNKQDAILQAQNQLQDLEDRLSKPLNIIQDQVTQVNDTEFKSNFTQEEFTSAVKQAKEHIAAGDIFQVVLSQKLTRTTSAQPFSIYRTLRRLNPSPYMFFFNFGKLSASQKPLHIIGASPEIHVRLEDHMATLRPIAGTRKRGQTPAEDNLFEKELLKDPKELAEHVMLVDLGRNDLGRVSEYGTVDVKELMVVERYSHVMHIVSHIEGLLDNDKDGFDLLKATFPAGTVSGAPKIRAMQIIEDLENEPRGIYAGAVGYFSYDGSLDSCISIRTMVMHGDQISIQAGAGIVADSDPDKEYEETLNKASALTEAVILAEGRKTQ